MKRKFLVFLSLVTLLIIFSSAVYALDALSYWYSDDTKINTHTDSNITVTVFSRQSITGMPSNTYLGYINNGLNAWQSSLGSSRISFSQATSNPELSTYDITRSEATNQGIPSNVAGFGGMSGTGTKYYSATYASVIRSFYRYPTSALYLIWDSSSSSYSANAWQYVTNHELGHALGYAGHNNASSTNLMYYSFNPNTVTFTNPKTEDRDHLYLVY